MFALCVSSKLEIHFKVSTECNGVYSVQKKGSNNPYNTIRIVRQNLDTNITIINTKLFFIFFLIKTDCYFVVLTISKILLIRACESAIYINGRR